MADGTYQFIDRLCSNGIDQVYGDLEEENEQQQ